MILNICKSPCSLPKSGRLTAQDFSRAPGVRTFRNAVAAMRAGRTYVNIHTPDFAPGEIRGQIVRDR